MTQPVQEPTQGRVDQGQSYTNRQLLRRPASGSGLRNGVGFPVSHRIDGMYLRPWTDDSQGNEAFTSPTADLTAPFGWYISSLGASQAQAEKGIWFGLGPLGKGTGWGVDLILQQGPNSGRVIIEFATCPIDENAGTIEVGYTPPGLGSTVSMADPYMMENGGVASHFSGWWKPDAAYTGIDLWTSGSPDWDYYPWYTFSPNMFWVGGDDGTMLTADGVNPGPYDAVIENTFLTGGGDQAWFMRVRSNGKHASSSGYGFNLAGFHMYRVNGNGEPVAF